ncbi:hypothetical protein CKO44_07805 [Rubrivivax gelatinosus]|uniref:phage tail tape measure protein n=1 Tax=Rubrivivax gelatinosus TaxID=28068 RepID=UPI00190722C2|nr:phage tail tape measure protein [Rubrivivax gelatinosus]MBK1613373.1 hypothetical protein [Rubrivivax gelatinosus]MBZ8142877.1 tail tape measure protein [Rubrivivax gelatinosus]
MRELKLKYFIDLVSNLGPKAQADAKAMEQAQALMSAAITGTNSKWLDYSKLSLLAGKNTATMQEILTGATNKFAALERAIDKAGRNTSVERQVSFLQYLSRAVDQVTGRAQRMGDVLARSLANAPQRLTSIAAAAGAAAAGTDRVTRAPMDYSLRLAHMANTAYSDRDVAGRQQGKRTLDAAITAALRTGGGSRDDAAEALDTLIASGKVPIETAITMLPALQRGSTASGASTRGLATISLNALQAGVKVDEIPNLLNMAMVSGQSGGFELKDMEKWLANAIAVGGGVGLRGTEGVRRILASLQASVITAGTKDEAGNNVVNLLGKINSEDTAKDFKARGIDLRGELMKSTANGGNALDAFIGLVDRVTAGVQKQPRFKALADRLAKEGDTGGETSTTESLRALFQGTAISKVVQDRQALMALVAEMNNRKYVRSVMDDTRTNTTAMSTSFGVVSQEMAFKRQQALNEAAIAGQRAFDKAAPALNSVADEATELAQRFPTLATTVVGATAALGVFTASLGAAGLAGLLTGRGAGAAGAAGRLAGLAGAAAPVGAAASGIFAGWQAWRLGDALHDLYAIKTREGVTLTPEARARIEAMNVRASARALALPGPAADALALTSPTAGGAATPLALQGPALQIGEGKLTLDVRVHDERSTVTSRVDRPLSVIRIDGGATNPAGYGAGR